ncbi:hypothetical protein HMPREF3189_00456 [Clostridiales bacterium KA00134]|nr:hypothetical protein HMPREF3189_00456 [Clostridiales bacterium KA00134]
MYKDLSLIHFLFGKIKNSCKKIQIGKIKKLKEHKQINTDPFSGVSFK